MKTAKTRTSPRTKSDKQKANKIRHFLRCRTTRTSPDKSIVSGGHLTGQDKVLLYKRTCLSECPSTWNFKP
jgi:hypothetical protein